MLHNRIFNPALFLPLAEGNGLALIQRCRALRCDCIVPAFGRLQCRLRQNGANPERRGAIAWREGQAVKSKGPDPDDSHQRTLNTSLPRRWRPSLILWAAAASDKA